MSSSARDRSRSPMFREGESETMMMMRMMDRIEALKNEVKEKDMIIEDLSVEHISRLNAHAKESNNTIRNLNEEVNDKNETIAELKVQIAELHKKIDDSKVKPFNGLSTLSRAALDVVCTHDAIHQVDDLRTQVANLREERDRAVEHSHVADQENAYMRRLLREQNIEPGIEPWV
jgi:DNA repair exonuclease SbcCD ATPase subunit